MTTTPQTHTGGASEPSEIEQILGTMNDIDEDKLAHEERCAQRLVDLREHNTAMAGGSSDMETAYEKSHVSASNRALMGL